MPVTDMPQARHSMTPRSTTNRALFTVADRKRATTCEKYKGNRINNLNSMAIVETDASHGSLRYAVVVLSNVLKKDSDDKHKELAAKIHALIGSMH